MHKRKCLSNSFIYAQGEFTVTNITSNYQKQQIYLLEANRFVAPKFQNVLG